MSAFVRRISQKFGSVTSTSLRNSGFFSGLLGLDSRIKRQGSPLLYLPGRMPPTGDARAYVTDLTKTHKVMVFSKSTCPFCVKVKDLFKSIDVTYQAIELDQEKDGSAIQATLADLTGQRTVPNVFIQGKHLGGCDATLKAHAENKLLPMINPPTDKYDYDLIVIGGGSGGLAASKTAAGLGKKVAVFDFVEPTPKGTTWGLGGTCVNVGCIPKKLMHQAAILGHSIEDARHYGWKIPEKVEHNWDTMKNAIQDHIGSLNWGYRVQLRDKKVDYKNAYAEFVDTNKITAKDKKGKATEYTAEKFIIATGERPRYPDIPGAKEYGITSDDLFSLPYCPGKTLMVGASYVSLECGGFLKAIGLDVSVMVRSILLRGFDQQMAEKIGEYMDKHGVNFVRPCVPTKVEQLEEGTPGRYKVTGKYSDGTPFEDEFNTVCFAIGRDPCTERIGLDKAGVTTNKTGFIPVDDNEQTNISNIFAIGDILEGKPELTPVAIKAGQLLAKRMFTDATVQTEYKKVATTVFTPIEYGCIGYSEEDAAKEFGEGNIEVYHTNFHPLEWTVAQRENNACYAKLICLIPDDMRVIGFHVIGPNAGEITQGFAVAMKLNATKADFDSTIGIHPTCAEVMTVLDVTKRSGGDISQSGC
ncbi:thioredoxin reductase 1, cytoplasmic-like [Mya arenaria]|uniref:thioredoxin reductase 1, cytoplasmic-like n=1 Tax=Mya arenaria TaxID=6604 RepID=UPI0022E1B077|nr:thioredoxin reductase 1, cytoplasmic-like [Mya arenaria]